MENKGISLCWKIPVLLLMVFAGTFSLPCMVVFVFAVPFMEMTSLPLSTMEDLLPRTADQRKKMDMVESALIAGIYTLAFILGYVLAFGLSDKYSWDRNIAFFLVKATLFIFFMLFDFRLWFIYAVLSGEDKFIFFSVEKYKTEKKKAVIFVIDMLGNVYCLFWGLFYILFYLIEKFTSVEFFQFLAGSKWKISLVVESIFFVALCIQTVRIWRQKYDVL